MFDKYHMLRLCRIDVTINGRVVQCASYGLPQLRIPHTDLYLVESTSFDHLCCAAGIKTYDYAMPVEWLRENYWRHGEPTPRGVWSYDNKRILGEFVSLGDMLRMVGESLRSMGITQIYAYA